jgi:DNA-binding transcriptional LysR family regulator
VEEPVDTKISAIVSRQSSGGLKDLTALRVFARVVELQSFSEVARRFGLTPATVSKHISSLEAQLRTRLVNRTTRRLFITESGGRLYQHCLRIIEELDQAECEVSEFKGEAAGLLRVAAPLMFGLRRLSPRLAEFQRAHPKVSLEVELSVAKVDLFQERIDVAMRIAEAIDPGLVAFRLAPYRRVFCASPGYLARSGTPEVPEDLAKHNCLIGRGATLNSTWPVVRGEVIEQVRVSGNFTANNGEVLRDAAVADMGLMMTARWQVEEDLRAKRLVEVLKDYAPCNRAIYAVLPRQGSLAPKVRAFVDFLKACCSDLR